MGNLKDALEELEKREIQEQLAHLEEEYLKARSELYDLKKEYALKEEQKKLRLTIREVDDRVRELSNRIRETEEEERNLENPHIHICKL